MQSAPKRVPIPVTRMVLWILGGLLLTAGGCLTFNFTSSITINGDPGGGSHDPDPDPCQSPSFADYDQDGMSDATEFNNSEYYPALDWRTPNPNASIASGDSTNGSLISGLNLKDQSNSRQTCGGYYHIASPDSVDRDDWGTERLLQAIELVSYAWTYTLNHKVPRVFCGDLSLRYGGTFWTQGQIGMHRDHAQHQKGIEVDIHYVAKGTYEGPLSLRPQDGQLASYDTTRTQQLINLFLSLPDIHAIIVYPGAGLAPDPRLRYETSEHWSHFHVWLEDPDGEGN